VIEFLSGASAVAAAAIALFFLRFWRDTDDRFFALFALAFGIFAINRVALAALDDESEVRTLVYLMRAVAFGVIVLAIVDKNRPQRR
jgi:predicted permease